MNLVSVVIPCYNDGALLLDSVASVLRQQPVKAHEVIVVDDCSTDDRTKRILEDLEGLDGSITVLRTDRNLGVAGARAFGCSVARGDWLAFLDADDVWLPCALATLESGRRAFPDARFIGADHEMWDGRRDELGTGVFESGETYAAWAAAAYQGAPRPARFQRPARLFLRAVMAWTGAVLVSRESFEQIGGFRPELAQAEDVHLWIRLAAVSDFVFCPRIVTRRRLRPDSLSHASARRHLEGRVMCDRLLLRDPLLAKDRYPARLRLQRSLLLLAREMLADEPWAGLKLVSEALITAPTNVSAWKRAAGLARTAALRPRAASVG